jgi:hypothetical protein
MRRARALSKMSSMPAAERSQEAPEGQRLRQQRDERDTEDDGDEAGAMRQVLRQREHGGHRESALDVPEDHHVLPPDRDIVSPERPQQREAAIHRDGAADVERQHRREDRERLREEHARVDLHSNEHEEQDVDPEPDRLPERLEREHA